MEKQLLNIKYLEQLTDKELKSFFTIEHIESLSDDGIVGEIKKYILSGKKDYTMGAKINQVEKLTIKIVLDRWLKFCNAN